MNRTTMKDSRLFIFFSVFIVLLIAIVVGVSRSTLLNTIKRVEYKKKLIYTLFEKDKINKVFKIYNSNIYGVDFSHYQGCINWKDLKNIHDSTPISFVFLRATMGAIRRDKYFKYNWKESRKRGVTVGAYHYYRPNENSTKQANNFIKNVKLVKGNLPPVLDIEKLPRHQSIKNMKIGLKNWLNIIERHYGVKPIIYTGDTFYKKYLSSGEFDNYILWIANFNKINHPKTDRWTIWQFSDKGIIKGVNEKVDFNVFNGNQSEFNKLLIQ